VFNIVSGRAILALHDSRTPKTVTQAWRPSTARRSSLRHEPGEAGDTTDIQSRYKRARDYLTPLGLSILPVQEALTMSAALGLGGITRRRLQGGTRILPHLLLQFLGSHLQMPDGSLQAFGELSPVPPLRFRAYGCMSAPPVGCAHTLPGVGRSR
jgi:hypothetical protein